MYKNISGTDGNMKLYLNASLKFPAIAQRQARVIPHPGHGNPKKNFHTQPIPVLLSSSVRSITIIVNISL